MIKLCKQPEPEILKSHGAQWLQVLENKACAGEVPTLAEKSRYRHQEIKAVLKIETHGKCAYCESRLFHVAFGDVEHIIPKSLKPADTFKWENLTLACDVCNTYKRDAGNLLDPYSDDPHKFFKFLGPMIYAIAEHGRGVITVKQLRLNRPDLLENRSKRLEAISSILLTIEMTSDPILRAVIIKDLLDNEAADGAEYAAFVRSFLATIDPKFVRCPT